MSAHKKRIRNRMSKAATARISKTLSIEDEAAETLASNHSLITSMRRALRDIAQGKTIPLRDLPRVVAARRVGKRPVIVQR